MNGSSLQVPDSANPAQGWSRSSCMDEVMPRRLRRAGRRERVTVQTGQRAPAQHEAGRRVSDHGSVWFTWPSARGSRWRAFLLSVAVPSQGLGHNQLRLARDLSTSWTQAPCPIRDLQIFSPIRGLSFSFLMASFEAQRFLILILKTAREKAGYLQRRDSLTVTS